jgi:hypothetical protein
MNDPSIQTALKHLELAAKEDVSSERLYHLREARQVLIAAEQTVESRRPLRP